METETDNPETTEATLNESQTPFTDGIEKGKGKAKPPGLDHHRERLKEAIRTHAKNNRKTVKARKGR